MITLGDYYMGRDVTYASELTPEIRNNAAITVARVNDLLADFYASQPQGSYRTVNSGWRPPEVNASTSGAARNSKHMTGEACDLSDDDEALDDWLLSAEGQASMVRIGLWQESPASTPNGRIASQSLQHLVTEHLSPSMIEFTLWGVLVKIWPGEILGIAMIAGGVWLFTRAQLDKKNPIDLSEMFVWPGTRHTSMAMFLAFVAGFSATWVVIDQEFRKTLSTELFLGYLAVMIGGKGLTEGINAWRNKPPGPPPPAIPPAQQQFVGTAGAVNAMPAAAPDPSPQAAPVPAVPASPAATPAAVAPRKRAKAKRGGKR